MKIYTYEMIAQEINDQIYVHALRAKCQIRGQEVQKKFMGAPKSYYCTTEFDFEGVNAQFGTNDDFHLPYVVDITSDEQH